MTEVNRITDVTCITIGYIVIRLSEHDDGNNRHESVILRMSTAENPRHFVGHARLP